jgi:hypothetical protein
VGLRKTTSNLRKNNMGLGSPDTVLAGFTVIVKHVITCYVTSLLSMTVIAFLLFTGHQLMNPTRLYEQCSLLVDS